MQVEAVKRMLKVHVRTLLWNCIRYLYGRNWISLLSFLERKSTVLVQGSLKVMKGRENGLLEESI